MADFASALYLGLRHPARELAPWRQLTTGVPAALASWPEAGAAARRLAALLGCERAVLAPSTLHLLWDLGGLPRPGRDAVLIDDGAYPIARWGAERARGRGVTVRSFAHHDPGALARTARAAAASGVRPIVVADGLCPACGGPAPLRDYAAVAEEHGGHLLVDDTQAVGILGAGTEEAPPYGSGGGGSLRHHGLEDSGAVVVASLAKGFGAPVAALAGPADLVHVFRRDGETAVHCSPPSIVAVRALQHALSLNRSDGDGLRARLAGLVERLAAALRRARIAVAGDPFPVLGLPMLPAAALAALHRRLLSAGMRTVPQRTPRGARIVLIVTARHTAAQIDDLVAAIVAAPEVRLLRAGPRFRTCPRALRRPRLVAGGLAA